MKRGGALLIGIAFAWVATGSCGEPACPDDGSHGCQFGRNYDLYCPDPHTDICGSLAGLSGPCSGYGSQDTYFPSCVDALTAACPSADYNAGDSVAVCLQALGGPCTDREAYRQTQMGCLADAGLSAPCTAAISTQIATAAICPDGGLLPDGGCAP